MADDYNWNNLPIELVILIGQRLCFAEDYVKFTAVCKSWKSAAGEFQKPFLPPRFPCLLLAEQVAPGVVLSHAFDDNDIDDNDDSDDDSDDNVSGSDDSNDDNNNNYDKDDNSDSDDNDNSDNDNGEDDNSDNDNSTYSDDLRSRYDHRNNSIGSTRGLYSLSTGKTYTIELSEAAGRLISGTNNGWLVTLDRDLQINLLHPLFRHQIPLPSMLTFPFYYDFNKNFPAERDPDLFVRKIVLSSRVPIKSTVTCSHDEYHNTSPIIMAICGFGHLGFARLGDKVWTDANIPRCGFRDIAYHKGKFYTVNSRGSVFVYNIDNDNKNGGYRGTEIASLHIDIIGHLNEIYLVETLSQSGLWLVLRARRMKYAKPPHRMRSKYRTIDFSLWKLELNYCECEDIPSCTLTEENNLGNEAIFVGKATSVSVSSSETIKPNCIYFTDDNYEIYCRTGGGHDMGIFHMESQTIEPHFPGKSIHPISPPLWYI